MIAALLSYLRQNSYEIYNKPFQLNIIGIRSDSTRPNRFDDKVHLFFKNSSGKWIYVSFPATTDPGTYWLQNPLSPKGTAILKGGQYKDAYGIGLHRGKYYALVQKAPVTVLRDYDRNALLDFQNGKAENGMFGINIHYASENGTTVIVDRYSAGCQVFARKQDFDLFMHLAEKHRSLYGNSFTYTLLDHRAITRHQRKKLAKILLSISGAVGLSTAAYQLLKQ